MYVYCDKEVRVTEQILKTDCETKTIEVPKVMCDEKKIPPVFFLLSFVLGRGG